jgi:DNA end-binding protein Ku
MRAIWTGAISFGLVTVPVEVRNASRSEELKFRLLRRSDLSPVNYRRVAAADGKEVPWSEIVKGYEYEKDKFVVLKDEDFKRVDLEATDTIDLVDFVRLDEINPVFFHRPYYLAPRKGGAGPYALLRDILAETGKAGIAKVIIRTRQHLAAVKPNGRLLVLELMRFADELVPPESIVLPEARKPGRRALELARTLVDQMSERWDPRRYTDDYRSALMRLIDRKIAQGGRRMPAAARRTRPATAAVDLAAVLQRSLEEARGLRRSPRTRSRAPRAAVAAGRRPAAGGRRSRSRPASAPARAWSRR